MQRLWIGHGPRVCLVTETTSHDIPYGDGFVVVEAWDVAPDAEAVLSSPTADGRDGDGDGDGGDAKTEGDDAAPSTSQESEPQGCRLHVSSKVLWSRPRPFVAGIVESKSREAVQETHAEWLSMAQDHAAWHTQSLRQGTGAHPAHTPSSQQSPMPSPSPSPGGEEEGEGAEVGGRDSPAALAAAGHGRRRDHRSSSSSHRRHNTAAATDRGAHRERSEESTNNGRATGRARAASTTALRAVDAAGLVAPTGAEERRPGSGSGGVRRRRTARHAPPRDEFGRNGQGSDAVAVPARRLLAARRAVERAVEPEDGPVLGPSQLAARPPAELTAQYHRMHGAYVRAVEDAAAARVVAASAGRRHGPAGAREKARNDGSARLLLIRRALTIAVCAALLALVVGYWRLAARVAELEQGMSRLELQLHPLPAAPSPPASPPPAGGPVGDGVSP